MSFSANVNQLTLSNLVRCDDKCVNVTLNDCACVSVWTNQCSLQAYNTERRQWHGQCVVTWLKVACRALAKLKLILPQFPNKSWPQRLLSPVVLFLVWNLKALCAVVLILLRRSRGTWPTHHIPLVWSHSSSHLARLAKQLRDKHPLILSSCHQGFAVPLSWVNGTKD